MGDRSERVLVATKAWRTQASEAFDSLKRGARARCARAVGCSEPQITKLLNGEIATSEFVGPISDWLAAQGVPMTRPQVEVTRERERELVETAAGLDDDRYEQVINLARLLRPK